MNSTPINPGEAIHRLLVGFGEKVTETLRSFLEEKHLYQSQVVPYEGDWSKSVYAAVSSQDIAEQVKGRYLQHVMAGWFATPPPALRLPIARPDSLPTCVRFDLPTIKVFCMTCDRREAFNALQSWQVLPPDPMFSVERGGEPQQTGGVRINGETVQVFAIAFQCQSCKGAPEVFVVRRQNTKLTLSGRSPIEHLDVPTVIPKPERMFWEGALLAHHSGQTLAGLFLLRTLIEQYAHRCVADKTLLGGDLITAYTTSLPSDFKTRFPSFADLYSKLSHALHHAISSTSLFDESVVKIVEHLDAKRLYKISDQPKSDHPVA